jgi:hypothetical protein
MATEAQIRKLVERQRQALADLDAATTALHAALAGDKTPAQRVAEAFDRSWGRRYAGGNTGAYVWTKAQDVPAIARLVKALSVEDIEERIERYIASADRFYVSNRHTFRHFAKDINKLAPESAGPLFVPAGYECAEHDPPCTSPQQHTLARQADMRATR